MFMFYETTSYYQEGELAVSLKVSSSGVLETRVADRMLALPNATFTNAVHVQCHEQ